MILLANGLFGNAAQPLSDILNKEHLAELRASGLSDETIETEGFRTIDSPQSVARDLGWKSSFLLRRMGPFLRIPYYGLDNKPMGYCRYKPLFPRTCQKDGGSLQFVKYEAPRGWTPPPYFPGGAVEAIHTPQTRLFITEGEKKALKATQEGFPCIGLPGVSNWSKKRKEDRQGRKIGKRRLNEWLQGIDWDRREVFIVFDTDDERNPDVNREAAELARVLEEQGATAHILVLPSCQNESGHYQKQGLDDYLTQYGPETLQRLIEKQSTKFESLSLEKFREAMLYQRENLSEPGFYLDRSPPGLGKSYLDTQAALRGGKMLVLLPTHLQCDSAVVQFQEQGTDAVKFPERSESNCSHYLQVRQLEDKGLNSSGIFCSQCSDRSQCVYSRDCRQALSATVTVATHERFHRQANKLTKGRTIISVHEDVSNFLAPAMEADDFQQIIQLAHWGMLNNKKYADVAANLFTVAQYCQDALDKNSTRPVPPHNLFNNPAWKVEGALNRLVGDLLKADKSVFEDWPTLASPLNGDALRICTIMMISRRHQFYVVQRSCHNSGVKKRSVVGIQHVDFPPEAIVLLNDGTATPESLPQKFRDSFQDITPSQQVKPLQSVVQYPVDLTQTDSTFLRLACSLRAILRQHPEKRRIGLITHKKFVDAAGKKSSIRDLLSQEENARLVKIDWFRGTESRGSNRWKEQCDLLIVAGTPRVPDSAIRNRLLQLGMFEAASRDGQWSSLDYWSGRCLNGQRVTVRSRGYCDHDWHQVSQQIVHAEIHQSVGRSRSVCPDGIPLTIVLSTEPLGYPMANENLEILNRRILEYAVLTMHALLVSAECDEKSEEQGPMDLRHLADEKITAKFAYSNIKRNLPLFHPDGSGKVGSLLKTAELARRVGIPSDRTARNLFAELEQFGLLTRKGTRKGWYVSAENLRLLEAIPESMFGFYSSEQAEQAELAEQAEPAEQAEQTEQTEQEPPEEVAETSRNLPIGQFWTPEMRSGLDGTAALFCITTSPEQPGDIPQLIVASAVIETSENLSEACFLTRETFPIFWEQNPQLNWCVSDLGKTLATLAATFDDRAKVYTKLQEKKITDVRLMSRLLSLARTGHSKQWDSLADCSDWRGVEPDVLSAVHSFCTTSPNFEEWKDSPEQIPPSLLRQLYQIGKFMLLAQHQIEEDSDRFIEEIDKAISFGVPENPAWKQRQRERFGILTHDIQACADVVYEEISRRGVRMDTKKVKELSNRYKAELKDQLVRMEEYGYLSQKPGVDDRAAQAVLEEYGWQHVIPFERKQNEISLAKNHLLPYVQEFEFIPVFLRAKELERWINGLTKMNKPHLYPQYSILGTTGRVYASGDLAIQTLPRQSGLRECIVPSPGSRFVIADYTMLELVLFAQALKTQFGHSSKLFDLINSGCDLHTRVAAMIFHVNDEEVSERERNFGKVLNFGILGGSGPKGLREEAYRYGFRWSLEKATQSREEWLDLFPEVRSFLADQVYEGVWTWTGRYRKTSEYSRIRNTIFQGLAADGMNLALRQLWCHGYKIAAVIHDEVILEIPEGDDYSGTLKEIEELMIAGMKEVAPDMDIRVKSFVANCWSEQAAQ